MDSQKRQIQTTVWWAEAGLSFFLIVEMLSLKSLFKENVKDVHVYRQHKRGEEGIEEKAGKTVGGYLIADVKFIKVEADIAAALAVHQAAGNKPRVKYCRAE